MIDIDGCKFHSTTIKSGLMNFQETLQKILDFGDELETREIDFVVRIT